MNENYFIDIFQSLISHKESEVVEFKKAENNFDFDDLGKYFSALSNEANLRGLDFAWLIFGYDEKKHEIVGTSYKNGESALNNLKHDFAQHTTDGQTFREIVPIEVDGKLTRAAIILLGKMFSDSKLRPAVAEVTWTLRDEKQDVVDYEHFSVPFILTVDEILAKIHNLTLREMPGGTLFPDTMKQYDDYTIREALHNCIAHQDYTLRQRINFVENPGFLYYANGGSFIPGTLENALATNGPQRFFRNACLCKAMVHFNMIDTVSRGIKKMFTEQMERRFPMPDYEIDNEKKEVAVRIYGNAINERYTKLLKDNNTLTLQDCISLDAIQKGHRIDEEIAQDLMKRGLIEGEAPNYTISLGVAKASKQLPSYTRVRGLERDKLKQMILQYIQNAGSDGAKRDAILEYLQGTLPSRNTYEQNETLIYHLLSELRKAGLIEANGKIWLAKNTQ